MARASHPILGCKSVSANGATQAIEVEERVLAGGVVERKERRGRENKKKKSTQHTRDTQHARADERAERETEGGRESVRDPREYRAGQKGFLTIERHSISAQLIYAE